MFTLLRCSACERSVSGAHAPLCSVCAQALCNAPPVCRGCGEWECRGAHEPDASIVYLGAPYLLVGQTHALLRTWKKRRGWLWQHRLVQWSGAEFWERLRAEQWQAVTAIPQHVARSWRMGGNPAEVWARAVARELGVPYVSALRRLPRSGGGDAQALRSAWERRHQRAPRWRAEPSARGLRVLLVDDFWTTGATAREGALALLEGGSAQVGVTALGVRPRMLGVPL